MPDEKKFGTIVTDLGTILIRDAVLEGKQINLTTLAVGDGGGYYYQPTADMTELRNERWSGKVNSVTVNPDSPNIIDVLAVIPSDVGGWTIREMCVKDEEGNMIAVCNTPDTEKVIITSGAAGEIEMLMHIEISNTGAITFIVDPYAITATKKDLREHDESQTAHKTAFDKKADSTCFKVIFPESSKYRCFFSFFCSLLLLDLSDPQEFRERRYEQKKALTKCKTVLFLIELSFKRNVISKDQCAAWTKYVLDVKYMTASWRKKDRERVTTQRRNAPPY